MKVSVCIGSVRADTLPATIDSIRRQTWSDWELIIVGQGADPRLIALGDRAAGEDRRIRYIHLEQRGASRARNAGIAAADADIIAMTDDDCEAREDWLATMVTCLSAEPRVGLVGGAVIAPPAPHGRFAVCPSLQPAEALYDPSSERGCPPPGWDWISANCAFRRSVAERVGRFDEYLGPGARFPIAEDTDYKLRLEALGIPMRTTPRAVVRHTYGYRFGLRAVWRNAKNYAAGNGALAAKLTLQGDRRGREWLETTRRQSTTDPLRHLRVDRLPWGLVRYSIYRQAYARCMNEFIFDTSLGVLRPRVPPHNAAA